MKQVNLPQESPRSSHETYARSVRILRIGNYKLIDVVAPQWKCCTIVLSWKNCLKYLLSGGFEFSEY